MGLNYAVIQVKAGGADAQERVLAAVEAYYTGLGATVAARRFVPLETDLDVGPRAVGSMPLGVAVDPPEEGWVLVRDSVRYHANALLAAHLSRSLAAPAHLHGVTDAGQGFQDVKLGDWTEGLVPPRASNLTSYFDHYSRWPPPDGIAFLSFGDVPRRAYEIGEWQSDDPEADEEARRAWEAQQNEHGGDDDESQWADDGEEGEQEELQPGSLRDLDGGAVIELEGLVLQAIRPPPPGASDSRIERDYAALLVREDVPDLAGAVDTLLRLARTDEHTGQRPRVELVQENGASRQVGTVTNAARRKPPSPEPIDESVDEVIVDFTFEN